MGAVNCLRFCLNPFCREVKEGCLPHDKNDSDKTIHNLRERSGSVVECLTRDRRAAGSSLTGVTALWSLSMTHVS